MIYILRMGDIGPVKIGFSDSPFWRIDGIASNWPYEPIVLAVLDGDREREKVLHRKFSPYHLRGEWFHPVKEILSLAQPDAHERFLKSKSKRHVPVKPHPVKGLTHAEKRRRRAEMAAARASGKTVAEVASQFHVSDATVKSACRQNHVKIGRGRPQ